MSDHHIKWEYSYCRVTGTLICLAPPDAECHLMPTCECEELGEILTGTYTKLTGHLKYRYHVPRDYPGEPKVRHVMKPVDGWCNIAEWFNNDDDLFDTGPDTGFVIAETPIQTVWVNGRYQWEEGTT